MLTFLSILLVALSAALVVLLGLVLIDYIRYYLEWPFLRDLPGLILLVVGICLSALLGYLHLCRLLGWDTCIPCRLLGT